MTSRSPTVSVLIPTYNRAALLKQAIDSVLAQTFGDFELIISDNASTDDTQAIVKSYSDNRIIYSRNPRNIGWHGNMKQCLARARGEYLTFLPDDDLMMPDNLERKVDVLRRYPRVGLVHSRFHMIDGEGHVIRTSTNWGHGPERDTDAIESGYAVLKRMLTGFCEVNLPTAMFRMDVAARIGEWTDHLHHTDDYEYWMRIAVFYDVAYLACPLIKWRWHKGSLTSQHVKESPTGVTAQGLCEQLLAKRMVLERYWRQIPEGAVLKQMVRQETRDRVILQADVMMDDDSHRREARTFLFKMCRIFPELWLSFNIWKTFLKTVLSPRSVQILKALCRP
jgi:GT2 family glycosyltransferase